MSKNIVVIGAGAWGTALAVACAKNNSVTLVSRNSEVVDLINSSHVNRMYLPDVVISGVIATSDYGPVREADIILVVTPSHGLRDTIKNIMAKGIKSDAVIVLCCKGIEENSCKLMSEVAAEEGVGSNLAVLSGPNFADEIARGLPACSTVAISDSALGEMVAGALSSHHFRIYHTDDIYGVQIGGAVKNVLAIACGICEGKKLGQNAKAALITRGIAEVGGLALALGGRMDTLMGLSGVGDIMLTCSSLKSRNMSLGFELCKRPLDEVMSDRITVAEGVVTVKSVIALADKFSVEMPICRTVYDILYKQTTIDQGIDQLLSRPLTREKL